MRFSRGQNRCFSLLTLALFWISVSYTQPPPRRLIDSLQHELASSRSDSQRVRILTTLSSKYFGIQPDSGMVLGRQAVELARKSGLREGEAEARLGLAACLWSLGQHLQAIDECRLALPVAEQLGNRRLQARIQHGIAINYGAIDKKDKAIAFLKKSLELQLQDGNDSGAMGCYHNLAVYSNELGKKQEALQYYEQALIHARRTKHGRGIAYTYMQLGAQQAALENETKGVSLLVEALKLFENLQDTSGMAECWSMRAQLSRQQRQYQEAIREYLEAIRLQQQVKGQYFRRVLSGYFIELASTYEEAPQKPQFFQLARDAWEKALDIAKSTEDWKAGARSAQGLSQLYRKRGESAQALHYFEEYIRYRDSFQNIELEKQQNLHELQLQYDDSIAAIRKLQDKQLLILRQENALRNAGIVQTRLYALIGVALLALFISILLYRNRIQKLRFKNELQQSVQDLEQLASALQKQISEATLAALQAQMNPHFIFNSLNVIQSFVYSGDKEQASQLIGTFSNLVRKTLEFSRTPLITLEEELAFIRVYTDLEVNRMAPGLVIYYQVEPSLELNQIQLPPLLIQPFVENAIRHGLYHKEGERKLSIQISGTNRSILVEIDDNGVGRAAANKFATKRDHLAFASSANEQRVALLNQLGRLHLDLHTIDKIAPNGNPEGTTVRLRITQHIA